MYHQLISYKCVWLLAGGAFQKQLWYGASAKAALPSRQQTSCHLVSKKLPGKRLDPCRDAQAPVDEPRQTKSVGSCTTGLGEGSELKPGCALSSADHNRPWNRAREKPKPSRFTGKHSCISPQ